MYFIGYRESPYFWVCSKTVCQYCDTAVLKYPVVMYYCCLYASVIAKFIMLEMKNITFKQAKNALLTYWLNSSSWGGSRQFSFTSVWDCLKGTNFQESNSQTIIDRKQFLSGSLFSKEVRKAFWHLCIKCFSCNTIQSWKIQSAQNSQKEMIQNSIISVSVSAWNVMFKCLKWV